MDGSKNGTDCTVPNFSHAIFSAVVKPAMTIGSLLNEY